MHSSDETGDERKGAVTPAGASPDSDPAKLPAHAFRERIRRASVAAAARTADSSESTGEHAALVPPEQSGVHDRAREAQPHSPSASPSQADEASEPILGEGSRRPTPRAWPFAPSPAGPRDEKRQQYHTQLGLGVPQRSSGAPAAKSEEPAAQREPPEVRRRAQTTPTRMVERPASEGGRVSEPNEARRRAETTPTRIVDRQVDRQASEVGAASEARRRAQTTPMLKSTRVDRTNAHAAHAHDTELGAFEDSEDDNEVERRRAETRDTAPTKMLPPTGSPGAYKVTPPRPFRVQEAPKWSATSTKPQRASLLRNDAPRRRDAELNDSEPARSGPHLQEEGGRYSLREASVEHVATPRVPTAPAAGSADPQGAGTAGARHPTDASVGFGAEDETARARRYTPKQRPTQRRGRGYERNGPGARPKDDRVEFARTLPDGRQAVPGRASGLQGSRPLGAPIVTPDTPTQPRGRPVPRIPFTPVAPFPAPRADGGPLLPPRTAGPAAQRGRELGREAYVHEGYVHEGYVHEAYVHEAYVHEAYDQEAHVREADAGDVHAREVHAREASIVVDPSLTGVLVEPGPSAAAAIDAGSGYQPLPSDQAAFEQLMREQDAARGSRLNWKQQATLVIPRDSLGAPAPERIFTPKHGLLFAAALVAGALIMLAIGQLFGGSERVATDTSAAHTPTSRGTVIATEPSGAELLRDGAVVGNTPLEVQRPAKGQGEITYTVRLRGFVAESVRLNADSQPAIRVTLLPEPSAP